MILYMELPEKYSVEKEEGEFRFNYTPARLVSFSSSGSPCIVEIYDLLINGVSRADLLDNDSFYAWCVKELGKGMYALERGYDS